MGPFIGIGIIVTEWLSSGSVIPANALLNDDGTPIINDDGSYILTDD